MVKLKFIVATNNIDGQGDIINMDGVKIPEGSKVPLTKDFNPEKLLGEATVSVSADGKSIQAEADIPDEFMGDYPAIGFEIIKSRQEGDVRVIEEMKLHYLGICVNENVDPNVKRLKDQGDA